MEGKVTVTLTHSAQDFADYVGVEATADEEEFEEALAIFFENGVPHGTTVDVKLEGYSPSKEDEDGDVEEEGGE